MTGFLSDRLSGGLAAIGLRLVVLAGPVLALLGTGLSGPWPRGWLIALTVALAVGYAAMPESPLGTTVLCLVLVWWALATDDLAEGVPVEAVAASMALLAAHLASLLLSYGPAGLPLDRAVLLRWLRRGLLLAASTPVVWLLAQAVGGQPEPPGIWVAGLAAAVVVCVTAASAVSIRDEA